MRSRWLGFGLGIVVSVAAIVALAPATLVDALLATRTQQRLRLTDATGFWWGGHGAIVTADGTARLPIGWRVDATPLLRGMVVVRLLADQAAAPTGTITIRDGRVELRDLRLRAPAWAIGAADSRLKTVALGGNVTLDAPAFSAQASGRSGELNATWERARVVSGETIVDLGTVTLIAAPAGAGVAGTIRNAGGDVAVSGTLADRGGVLDAALTLQANPTAPDGVRNLLPLLGTADGSGGVQIRWHSNR